MNRAVRRGVVLAAGAAVVAWGGGQLTGSPVALADATTSAVTAGPSTFTQAQASGGPSQYDTPLERCSHGVDYPITGTNPILSEPVTTSAQSNVPISITARYEGNEWYGVRYLDITNTGTQAFNLQCAVLIFLAPSNSDQHYYTNTTVFGHPQEDFLEVPRGDGSSYYIIRFGFHDVAGDQQSTLPGGTFTYKLGGAPSAITLEQTRDSVRLIADLTLASNTNLVTKYGTKRLSN